MNKDYSTFGIVQTLFFYLRICSHEEINDLTSVASSTKRKFLINDIYIYFKFCIFIQIKNCLLIEKYICLILIIHHYSVSHFLKIPIKSYINYYNECKKYLTLYFPSFFDKL